MCSTFVLRSLLTVSVLQPYDFRGISHVRMKLTVGALVMYERWYLGGISQVRMVVSFPVRNLVELLSHVTCVLMMCGL